MDSPPLRLYKYQPFSALTLTSLKARTIWFGAPEALNDPFDCAVPLQFAEVTKGECKRLLDGKRSTEWAGVRRDPRYVDAAVEPTTEMCNAITQAGRAEIEKFVAETYAKRGITCFSETPDHPLLWAHYGGGHRGICLEFDTSSPWLSKLHRVRYAEKSHKINLVDALLGDHSQVISTLYTKSSCWSYESEWRGIHNVAKTNYAYGVEALTGVYLGARLSPAELDIVCHTLYKSPTKLYRMQRSDDSFALHAEPVTYTPYTGPPEGSV